MARLRQFLFTLLMLFLIGWVIPVHAQTGIRLINDQASLAFPESATFRAEFRSGAAITAAVLEYGVDQLTCGTVIAKAFPQVTAGTDVQVEWTWEMRQSGSLPPGASLWWRWQVTDANGVHLTSPKQTILWLDSQHAWAVISGGNINLHYYSGGSSFGKALHDAAAQALVRLSRDVGLQPEKPVDIFIYANTDDLKASILYEPTWVGGQAYPGNNIVIIGVSPDQLDWGKSTEAHELTHVLVGHLTFSCLGFVPTWLNEGLAMYGEGGPQAAEQAQFDQAVAANQLLALRSLTGNFSEEADRATLSYTESYSVVNFLIATYGRDKMTALLNGLRDGQTGDEALQAVYGFDVDGLEDAWRSSIGAAPRPGMANPTPAATPTVVPTIVPVGGVPLAAVQTPTSNLPAAPGSQSPTQGPNATPTTSTLAPASTPVPLSEQLGLSRDLILWVVFLLVGCVLVLATILVVWLIVRGRRRRK
jgi:hypothetical protein